MLPVCKALFILATFTRSCLYNPHIDQGTHAGLMGTKPPSNATITSLKALGGEGHLASVCQKHTCGVSEPLGNLLGEKRVLEMDPMAYTDSKLLYMCGITFRHPHDSLGGCQEAQQTSY